MSKITYTDKVTLNENPNVADVNKVKASDMNEIKNVVNANDKSTVYHTINLASLEQKNIMSLDKI